MSNIKQRLLVMNGQRLVQIAVMVSRHLGDDERRRVGTDLTPADGDVARAGLPALPRHGVLSSRASGGAHPCAGSDRDIMP